MMKEQLRKIKNSKIPFIIIVIFTIITTIMTFYFSNSNFEIEIFKNLLGSPFLIILNALPIIFIFILILNLTSKVYLSMLGTYILFFIMGIANRTKMLYRDSPLQFEDIKLIFEAKEMTNQYKITIGILGIIFVLFLIFLIIMTILRFKQDKITIRHRFKLSSELFVVAISLYLIIYSSTKISDRLTSKNYGLNLWLPSSSCKLTGLNYTFVKSVSLTNYKKPKNYNKENQIKKLNQFTDEKMDKKPNIVAFMLEAYSKFDKYDITFINNPYDEINNIYQNSYHGDLIANIFGGGTINTERSFLTGNLNHGNYTSKTDSFVRYLTDQGYLAESFHPITGAFYNRRNVNYELGFNEFYYNENYFNDGNLYIDDYFFKKFKPKLKENLLLEKPYFSFSVTYQNHGPYDESSTPKKEYIKKSEDMTLGTYNMLNNYFTGIENTNEHIQKLISEYEDYEEPIIFIFFGDHNPYLGENNIGYNSLGIDINNKSLEDYTKKYTVPYFMYGNKKAKTMLNKDFVNEGNTISPNYLMPELFEYLGIKGSKYMQYNNSIKKKIPVMNDLFYKTEQYTLELDKSGINILNDYKNMEYYQVKDKY